MAAFLYRLGRPAFRRRGYVVLIWPALLTAVGLGALRAPGASDEEFSMPGIESRKAYDLMQERFPGAAADGATARVVTALGDGSQVAGVVDPFEAKAVSRDGSTAARWPRARASCHLAPPAPSSPASSPPRPPAPSSHPRTA